MASRKAAATAIGGEAGPGPRTTYAGPLDCARQLWAAEGATGFYRGGVPNFARLSIWNIAMFMSYEQLKLLFKAYA
jgi:hypothetical protein